MKIKPALPRKFSLARLLLKVLVIALTFIFFFGALIVPLEIDHPDSTIHNFLDGIWWSAATVSTVGYGDVVPVTVGGKILGIILQLTGASIFFGALVGTLTVYIHHAQDSFRWKRLDEKMERLENDSKVTQRQLDFLIKNQQAANKKPRPWGL
ncbi:MAG TPA: potassium channel family protein [Patescibacteria group bacterium]|jgi:voltage-gated potassium channel